jgi:hypothetical protein
MHDAGNVRDAHAGMDMSSHHMMPGMLTRETDGRTETSKGDEFDHLF